MNFIKRLFSWGVLTPSLRSRSVLPSQPAHVQVNEITPQQLKTRLENGHNVVVVDMRQEREHQSGHIPGAIHIFIHEIPARIDEIPKDTEVVFQCWHGNTSLNASAFLIQSGWDADQVSSLRGGISGWVSTFGNDGLVSD